jgi:hypothetical protein
MSDLADLRLRVASAELASSEVAELTRNLRAELLRLEVDDVRTVSAGSAPAGAKAGELIEVGALVVSLVPVLATAVVEVVASWLRRQPSDIEVDIDGYRLKGQVTREQRDTLVAAFLARAVGSAQQ